MLCLTLKYYIQNNEYVVLWLKHRYLYVCPTIFFIKRCLLKAFFCYKSRKSYTIVLKLKMSEYWSHKPCVRASGGGGKEIKQVLSNKKDLEMLSRVGKWDGRVVHFTLQQDPRSVKEEVREWCLHSFADEPRDLASAPQPPRVGGTSPSSCSVPALPHWGLPTWPTAPRLPHCQGVRDAAGEYLANIV